MQTVSVEIHVGRVTFTPTRRVTLKGAWSGVYSGKIVYDALQGAGLPVEEGGFFRVTPLHPARGGVVPATATLLPGSKYYFDVYIWDVPGKASAHDVINGIALGVSALNYVSVEEVRFKSVRIQVPHPSTILSDSGEDPCAAVYLVDHGPTYYRFQGAIINYPSPRRMLASIARRLTDATTIDYKEAAHALSRFVELYRFKVKRHRFTLSHGMRMPIFFGPASYYIVASRVLVEAFGRLLEAARFFGLGGGPGVGMGEVKRVRRLAPPENLPPPVKPCYAGAPRAED